MKLKICLIKKLILIIMILNNEHSQIVIQYVTIIYIYNINISDVCLFCIWAVKLTFTKKENNTSENFQKNKLIVWKVSRIKHNFKKKNKIALESTQKYQRKCFGTRFSRKIWVNTINLVPKISCKIPTHVHFLTHHFPLQSPL